MKKFLFYISFIGLIFFLTSCTNTSKHYYVVFKNFDDTVMKQESFKSIDDLVFPQPDEVVGYTFSHWEYEGIDESSTVINENVYKSYYTPNLYTIDFEFDLEYFEKIEVIFDSPVGDLPTPEKEGFVFEGWYYKNNLIDENTIYKFDFSVILSPRWTEKTYKIEYYSDGELIGFRSALHKQYINDLLIPSKNTHQFVGWKFNGEILPVEFVFDFKDHIKLEAVWTPHIFQVDIYDEFGLDFNLTTYYGDEITSLPYIDRPNYEFIGWFINGEEITLPFIYTFDYGVSIEARWAIKKYNISFDVNGGNIINELIVESGSLINDLPTPQKKDYVFTGWSLENENINLPLTYDFKRDITLKANWQIKEFDIFYDYDDLIPKPVYANQTIESLEIPFKPNYNFMGWSFNNNLVNLPFVYDYDQDILLKPIWEIKSRRLLIEDNDSISYDFKEKFTYTTNDSVNIPIVLNEYIYFDKEDHIKIYYHDLNRETLDPISLNNDYYFSGFHINEVLLKGIDQETSLVFELNSLNNFFEDESFTMKPSFKKLYDVSIKSIYDDVILANHASLLDLEQNHHTSFKAISDYEIDILALEEYINSDTIQYLFKGFNSHTGILNEGSINNKATYRVSPRENIIYANYDIENILLRIMLTEQDDIYNNQPISFNGIVINYDAYKFGNTDVIQKPYIEIYVPFGQASILLLSGRKGGIVESPGLFLASLHYSNLPEDTLFNGAFTKAVNGKEFNRFYEENTNYTRIFDEHYSELLFNTSLDNPVVEIGISFVPVYAVNEKGLVDKDNNINNEIRTVADFGTFSEATNFEDSEFRNKVVFYSEFRQLEDFKAEHVFSGLGNQAVFIRPVVEHGEVNWLYEGHRYNGLKENYDPYDLENHDYYSTIENANIFIPLHHDGGDYAIFGKEVALVSYLNVKNTTIVRGSEINSTINNPINRNNYTFHGSRAITEYKLRVGGVASLTRKIKNVRAVGLNIEFGLLYEVNELDEVVKEEKVIAYVGGIAGATGRIGVSNFSTLNNNIVDSEFVGKINITNVNGIVGGIAGVNISGISSSHSSAEIEGYGYIGGIVGENRGVIEGTLFSGSLTVYGVGGGTIGINNPLYFGSSSSSTQIRFNIGGGSTKVLGANDKQFPIWYSSGYSATYNNYAGGFVGVSSLANFNSNYINNNDARLEGSRVSPFFGLIDFTEYRTVGFEIKNNYIVSSNNTVVNTDNKNIPALGYWINHSGYSNSNLFSNTVLSINKTNPNITFESKYTAVGLNANNVLYTQAELIDNLFTSFIDKANANSVSRFVFKPNYTITNQNKYNAMINHQNTNLPFLSVGYKVHYEVKDLVRVSLAVFENNTLNLKQLQNFTDWTVTPINYESDYGFYYQTHYQTPNLVFYVTKYTQIDIEVKRSESIVNGYFLKDYHRFFEYSTPQNETTVNYDREISGEHNLVLVYNTNSSEYLRQTVVNEISLQVATESSLSSEIYNYSYESGFDVYEEYSFTNIYSYSYEDNFTLTSKNKGVLTTGVKINVEKLSSENKNQITKLTSSHTLDIKDLNNLTFNSVDGLEIVITKTVNEFGFEVLNFNVTSTGVYSVRISTTSSVRVSLEVTGVDENLTDQYVSDVSFVTEGLYNHRVDLVDTIYNQNLSKTEMLVPLTTDNNNDLLNLLITLNHLHPYEGFNYSMVPEVIEINGNKVFDNEFIFDQSQTIYSRYVHEGTSISVPFATYLNDIQNNTNGFNVRVNYELVESFVRVDIPADYEAGTNSLDSVHRFIDFEFNLNANTNSSYIERSNLRENSQSYKAHKQGATLRLLNLEKLPNNIYTKQDPVTGDYRSYTVSNDIYKVTGQDRLVRVLLTASSDYRNYSYYVSDNGENPNPGEHNFKFTTDLLISVDEILGRNFFFGINIYEVYEVEISSGLSDNSFGTLKELTPENMPVASMQGNLNEAVEFRTINDVTLLNSFATLNSVERTDNKQFLLTEFGSRIKVTSNRDNITDELQLERLEFDRWTSRGSEVETNDRLNEELLYDNGIKRNQVYIAAYKFKTVRVYIRNSMTVSTASGRYEASLPQLVPANSEIADELVLDSRMEGVYEVAEYLYNGKIIAKSDPSRVYGLTDDPIIIPLDYEHQGERLYEVRSTYRAIDITYGEELEFVVKDYSNSGDVSLENIKTGVYKLYTFLEERGHEDYYTNIKESDPADIHINKFALLEGDSHWIHNNSETGATVKVRGQVFGEFIIGAEFLPIRQNQIGYNIDRYDGANTNPRKHSIVRYSNPILNSNVVASYETLNNPLDFNAYKYSNIEIMFNLTAISQEHGVTINDFDWMIAMNQNYAGDGDPILGLLSFRVNHAVGEGDKITREQYMNFHTSTEIIDGDLYAVLRYNLAVYERAIFLSQNIVWTHDQSEQMFTTLIINPKDNN